MNERDEEEEKRGVNHEYFGPFHTNMYIQMDYLSVVCIRHLLTFFSSSPFVCILFRNEPIYLYYYSD